MDFGSVNKYGGLRGISMSFYVYTVMCIVENF